MATKQKTTTKATKSSAPKETTKASAKSATQSPVKRFRALLEKHGKSEACSITIPFDVEKTFGVRSRLPVRGTINGFAFRNSIFPMRGCFMMPVNRDMRSGAGVEGGETISVVMERDTEPRVITPPADLARALKTDKEAKAVWDKLSFTHKREHVRHIEEAKKPETRQRRIENSIALLAAGKKEPRG